jgi:Carboxypeptidase regulatory-like domain
MRTTKFPEFLLIMAIACASLAAQNSGVVRGRVVDETGRTVEGVSVECDPIDSRPSGSAVRTVQTDKAGNFLVDRLSFGSYKLFARNQRNTLTWHSLSTAITYFRRSR